MRIFCAAAALLLGGLTLCASVFETGRNGTIKVDNTAFVQLLHYGENWVPNRQGDGSFNTQFTERDGVRSWSGVWKLRQSPVHPQFRTRTAQPGLRPPCNSPFRSTAPKGCRPKRRRSKSICRC